MKNTLRFVLFAGLMLGLAITAEARRRWVPPTAVPFTPASVPGLVEWLDASTITGSDGDPQSTWTAIAGGNATSSGTQRPQLFNAVINGKNVLRFVSANAVIATGAVSITGTTLTVFAVFTSTGNSNGRLLSLGVTGSADFNNVLYTGAIKGDAGAGTTVQATRNSVNLSTSSALTTSVAVLITTKFDGTNNTLYQNGIAKTPAASTGAFGISNFRVGGNLTSLSNWNGDVGEILIYNTAVGSTDQANIEAYLRAKWGTP